MTTLAAYDNPHLETLHHHIRREFFPGSKPEDYPELENVLLPELAGKLRRDLLERRRKAEEDLALARRHVVETLGSDGIDEEGNLAPAGRNTPVGRAYETARERARTLTHDPESAEALVFLHLNRFFCGLGDASSGELREKLDAYLKDRALRLDTLAEQGEYFIQVALAFRDLGRRIIDFVENARKEE